MTDRKGKKVFVGLSGGVDSSVSALLLKEAGFDVHGVFIKVWQPEFVPCTWREDRLDALQIASALNIPFYTLDLEKVYKKEVIDYMLAEYDNGRTPNPDVFCNKYVKFGAFFDWAIKNGADYVATGHYAQIEKVGDDFLLKKSADNEKDQTYFLWTLDSSILSQTIFPVGNIKKDKVREIAIKNNLITAQKKDSQGLCFISNFDMKDFLRKFLNPKSGNVLDENNNIIGSHDGARLYTIGERHGFTVHSAKTNGPYYVIKKDINLNTITVSTSKVSALLRCKFSYKDENLHKKIENANNLEVRLRYRGELYPCKVDTIKKEIISNKNLQAVSGQSAVLYDGDFCLGGAIIE